MREEQHSTSGDFVTRFFYASLGLHCGFKRARDVQHATFAFWLAIHFLGVLSALIVWYRTLSATSSSSLFAILVLDFLFIGSLVSFQVQIILYHDKLRLLLQRRGRSLGGILKEAVLTAPFLFMGSRGALSCNDLACLSKEIYFWFLHLTAMVFFLVCGDILWNLQDLVRNTLAHAEAIGSKERTIRKAKWEFRDRVKDVNKIFSWIWAMQHVMMLITNVYIVSWVTDRRVALIDRCIITMFESSNLVRLFGLAWRASAVNEYCFEIEKRVLNGAQVLADGREAAKRLLPVITFREEWDVLRNGCFPLGSSCFFRFLATSVALTGAILQFDHRIARVISDTTGDSHVR